jgi:hypothetical protein
MDPTHHPKRIFLNITWLVLLSLATASCKPASPLGPALIPSVTGVEPEILSPLSETPAGAAAIVKSTMQVFEPTPTAHPPVPYELVSLDSMLGFLDDLTKIQAYSGWRMGGSQGEAEALQYVEDHLKSYAFLNNEGLEIERQSFPVYLAVELWESRIALTIAGKEIEVPASGLRGSRYEVSLARRFDSDGGLNDSERNPVIVSGRPLLVRDMALLYELTPEQVKDRLLFLDYAMLDPTLEQSAYDYAVQLAQVVAFRPAGIVLVTQYSNQDGESRGSLIGDGGVFQWFDMNATIPILHVRVEDMIAAGITDWAELEQALAGRIESVRLTWDADVFSPGKSSNLVARIPGADPSQAVIVGAHIDSPNGPGAFDDGSGVVSLLELARVIDAARIRPPVDLILVWFGGHELGIYGSAHFAATHQELLDRTLAMLQLDCLGYPLENHQPVLNLDTWTYGQFGDDRPVWPDYLAQAVAPAGVDLQPYIEYGLIADNSNFVAFDVPNADLIYSNLQAYSQHGSGYLHYATHLHDPYETVDLARGVGAELEGMARTALAAALQTGWDKPKLRVVPKPSRRALFVASHTQSPDVAPTFLAELGMALAWQGFDVDLIPHGQPITAADLTKDNGDQYPTLVLLLPTLDYSGAPADAWSSNELNLLEKYVKDGGLLVVTNSTFNLAMSRLLDDMNEDSRLINALTERFGVRFRTGTTSASLVTTESEHPLMSGASYLKMIEGNGVPFSLESGQVLAGANSWPVLALVDYGGAGGQVLVVGDIGLLSHFGVGGKNLDLLKNLARYAWERR